MNNQELIKKLNQEHSLSMAEWEQLFENYSEEDVAYATELARKIAVENFGKKIYFRGIIEFTNHCKCDCFYCGIRKSNRECQRYRLELSDILACCAEGYENGFRTFGLSVSLHSRLHGLMITVRFRQTPATEFSSILQSDHIRVVSDSIRL